MQQQIALQRALLALAREDEELRRKVAEKTTGRPALARGLEGGVRPYAGPTPTLGGEPAFRGGMEYSPVTTAFRPGAGSLEEALRAAQPTAGYVSGEEKARLARERMAGEEEELAGKAGEFWERIEPLDDEGEKIALDACRKHQPDLYRAMIEQGYVDKTTGLAVKPEEKRTPWTRDTHVEDGWLYEDIVYDDGTSTHEIIGRAEEKAVEAPSISDIVALEKLGISIAEFGERHLERAIKTMGNMPRAGLDPITEEGVTRLATVEDEKIWKQGIETLATYYRDMVGEAPEAPLTLAEVKTMYEGRPELISDIQQQLGLTVTGVWDDELEEAFRLYGGVM